MDLTEAEEFIYRVVTEDFDLKSNLVLLRRFIVSWIETAPKDEKFIRFVFNWYKYVLENSKRDHFNENSCILAVVIADEFLNSEFHTSVFTNSLFLQIILLLQELMTCNLLNLADEDRMNIETLLVFYKIHEKLVLNAETSDIVKKHGLWKPLMHFYLKNNKFNFLLQNICTEYLNHLLCKERLPDELLLMLEILTSNAQFIKTKVETGCFKDRDVFCSFRLLYHVLSRNISRVNPEGCDLISRKCHSLIDLSLKVSLISRDIHLTKFAFLVHLLLKYCCAAAVDHTSPNCVFQLFMSLVSDTLIHTKFLKFASDVCALLEVIFPDSFVQNFCIYIRVTACELYLRRLSLDVDLPFQEVEARSSINTDFMKKYRLRLQKATDLQLVVDSILKMITHNVHMDENNGNFLIRFLMSVLKSFAELDNWVSGDLISMLINVIHAVGSLLTKFELTPDVFDDIFETSVYLCRVNPFDRIDAKLAAFGLCKILLEKQPKSSQLNIELLKQTMIDGFQDTHWEVRDCVLEIMAQMFASTTFTEINPSGAVMNDPQFSALFFKTLRDEESYVRASAYKTLSLMLLLPNSSMDCEKLLLQTAAAFEEETEFDVRVSMITFIQRIWETRDVTNIPSSLTVYRTVYSASCVDLHDEVRFNGMCFWLWIVQCLVEKKKTENNEMKIFDHLSSIGCLQALTHAIEDEYDERIKQIALNILDLLLSVEKPSENYPLVKEYEFSQKPFSRESPESKNYEEMNKGTTSEQSQGNVSLFEQSSSYISWRDFFAKYDRIKLEEKKAVSLDQIELFNLNDLLHIFKKFSFEADINEKDCY